MILSGMIGGLGGCQSPPKETLIPIELFPEEEEIPTPPNDTTPDTPPPPLPPPPPPPPPPPQNDTTTTPATTTTTTRPKKPIEKSTKIVTNNPPIKLSSPTPKPITQDELRETLNLNPPPNKEQQRRPPPTPSNEDSAAVARIKQVFRNAWIRPSADQKGSRRPTVEIRIDNYGNVLSRKLASSSGSAAMDASVMNAANAVRRLDNLPRNFATRYPVLTIQFNLEE